LKFHYLLLIILVNLLSFFSTSLYASLNDENEKASPSTTILFPLKNLPNDILEHILPFLEGDSLMRLQLTGDSNIKNRLSTRTKSFSLPWRNEIIKPNSISSIARLYPSLTEFIVLMRGRSQGNTFFAGVLPESILSLTSLRKLNVSNCGLTALPGMSSLRSLEELYLSENNFTEGKLPESVSSLTSLRILEVCYGELTTFPDISSLRSLEELYLSENNFTEGTLPENVSSLTSLRILEVGFCNLTTLPDLSSLLLEVLDLAGNKFTGEKLPESILSFH